MISKIKYSKILIPLFFLLFFTLYSFFFIVNESKVCFIVRFGKIVKKIDKSGLSFKIPLIDNVIFFDKRAMYVDLEQIEIISKDQKRFTIDATVRYKIKEPSLFYKTLRNEELANVKINSIFNSLVRQVIGTKDFLSIVNIGRSSVMSEIESKFNEKVQEYGIIIVDVRIIKLDLPIENTSSVYERMITERQKEAAELIRSGEKEAEIIKSKSKKESEIIKANALLKAMETEANSKAEAIKIEIRAYSKDLKFYTFFKKSKVYKKLRNISMLISQDILKNIDIIKNIN